MGEHFLRGQSKASEVAEGIWMGDAPPIGPSVGYRFSALVLAAKEYQPSIWCFPEAEVIGVELNDDGSPMTREEAFLAVTAAQKVIAWTRSGRDVLVTCMQGRNRSGLIAALALCYGPHKMSPEKSIGAIREARGAGALSNPYFVSFIRSICSATGFGT